MSLPLLDWVRYETENALVVNAGDLKAARRLLQDYKDKDLDFGLDTQALSELIQDDKEWAEDIILAFGSTNGMYV